MTLRAGIIGSLFLCLLSSATHAGSVVNDLSLGNAAVLHSGSIFTINPGSGKQVGGNLFYSLSTLNLDPGETAIFNGPSSAQNVLTRVTGGPSTIDGTIQCLIPNVSFLLINPDGVVFGPGASLNISGSFTVTTANLVKLADGTAFAAIPSASDATLTTAAPAAFGFLSNPAGGVKVLQNAALSAQNGNCLSIVAGPVKINGGQLFAEGGRITIASVGSAGTVRLDPANPASSLNTNSFPALGPVTIVNVPSPNAANLIADSPGEGPGGQIEIQGDSLTLNNATVSAQTFGPGQAGGIDLNVRGNLSSNFSEVTTDADGGNAGNITATVANAALLDNSGISASNQSTSGVGTAGVINLSAASLTLQNDSSLQTITSGTGNAGSIVVNAQAMAMSGQSFISAETSGGGNGGIIDVTVSGSAIINDSAIGTSSTQTTSGAGAAGQVSLDVGELKILNGSTVAAMTDGPGDAGGIVITGASAKLSGQTQIDASAGVAGNAGTISFNVGDLTISGGAQAIAISKGVGASGQITVTASDQVLLSGSVGTEQATDISITNLGSGPGGSITIETPSLTMSGGAFINATNSGGGQSSVTFQGGSLLLESGASIANGSSSVGLGGPVTIDATGSVVLDGTATPTTTTLINAEALSLACPALTLLNGGEIDTDVIAGPTGGNLNATVSGPVLLSGAKNFEPTGIFSATGYTAQAGNAGNVILKADSLIVSSATISSATLATGQAGNIFLRISGDVDVSGDTFISASSLSSHATGSIPTSGNGGSLKLKAAALTMTDGASIDATTDDAGNAGNVQILVGDFNATTGSSIQAASSGPAQGGNVIVDASTFSMNTSSILCQGTGAGGGGSVVVEGAGGTNLNDSGITANSTGSGNAGSVTISASAGEVGLTNGTLVTTSAEDLSGNVLVNGGTTLISGQGGINVSHSTVAAEATGNGGDIELKAPSGAAIVLDHSTITGRAGLNGGQITIDPAIVALNHSLIDGLAGGRDVLVTINADEFLESSDSEILTDRQAFVVDTNIVAGLVSLPQASLNDLSGLEPTCEHEAGTNQSSFIVVGHGGLPPEPGGWVPREEKPKGDK
jgi:filamentous hemagglutinin family protein